GGEDKLDNTMKQKLENFSVSYIEAIAARRQRNVEWAKSAVKESASISAEKALQLKVVDLIAADLPELLKQVNGRVVDGKTLKTTNAEVSEIKMSASEHVFQKLWRPEVMFVLMLIAIYGIIGELTTPGAILPGVVGAIALVLALYLAAILPVNVTGLVLIALALMLFIFDVYAPTHGVLTVGGIISFLIGSLMLFNRADPLFRLSLSYIIPATLVTAAFFVFVIGKGLRAQLLPIKAGAETLIGKTVTALTAIDSHSGRTFVEGEHWNAVSDTPIEKDEAVEIAAVHVRTLKVKTKGEYSEAITRRTTEASWLGRANHHPSGDLLAPGDPDTARTRARGDFPSRKITRRERAGTDSSHPDRRSNGAHGFARRHHQRREAGGDDARQRAGHGRCGRLFSRGRSGSRRRESGELSPSHLADVADDAAQRTWPSPLG